jgi:hypothetical protein
MFTRVRSIAGQPKHAKGAGSARGRTRRAGTSQNGARPAFRACTPALSARPSMSACGARNRPRRRLTTNLLRTAARGREVAITGVESISGVGIDQTFANQSIPVLRRRRAESDALGGRSDSPAPHSSEGVRLDLALAQMEAAPRSRATPVAAHARLASAMFSASRVAIASCDCPVSTYCWKLVALPLFSFQTWQT